MTRQFTPSAILDLRKEDQLYCQCETLKDSINIFDIDIFQAQEFPIQYMCCRDS